MSEADEQVRAAAQYLYGIGGRVCGDHGVVNQVVAGDFTKGLSPQEKLDLAALLEVAAERLRFTRSEMGSMPAKARHADFELSADGAGGRLPFNRKERYFTGTVLPMLVASDGFAHLPRFLALCGLNDVTLPGRLDDHGGIDFYTEYGFAESVFTDEDRRAWPDPVQGDTPDVVISGPDWLLAVEAKMFHNPSRVALESQMDRQHVLVEYWARNLGLDPGRVRHVLLLPARLARRVGPLGHAVVTWEEVLERFDRVGPHYWGKILARALAQHEQLESRVATRGANADAVLTGEEILTAYAQQGTDFDHVGRSGGLTGTAFKYDRTTGAWRQTKYEVRSGALPGNRNWFSLSDFIAAIASIEESHR